MRPGGVRAGSGQAGAPPNRAWRAETKAAHADYLAFSEQPTAVPGGVNLGEIVVWLRDNLPDDAFLCNGAGNFSGWIHRFYRFRKFATQVAPMAGSMGYGLAGGDRDEAGVSPSAPPSPSAATAIS